MAVSATVRASIAGQQTNPIDLGTGNFPFLVELVQSFDDGVAANQVNRVWTDTITLAASATQDLDLAGVLTDAYGAVITFARIKAIAIKALAANTNNVVLGAAAATQFVGFFGAATHTVAIQPGGAFLIVTGSAAGWPVTAAATDFLRVANSGAGTGVTFDIAILGGAT